MVERGKGFGKEVAMQLESTSVNLHVRFCLYLKVHFYILIYWYVSDAQIHTDTENFISYAYVCISDISMYQYVSVRIRLYLIVG